MQNNQIYKYLLKVTKNKELKFISHLDWQNLILKVFRRCELNLVLSQGFNKMPKVSYSPALPIFIESDCELICFQVYDKLNSDFVEKFNKFSSQGVKIVEFREITDLDFPKSLENYCQWAEYKAKLKNDIYNLNEIRYIIDKCLSSNELFVTKKTKKGIEKTINYRNSLKSFNYDGCVLTFVLKAGQNEEIPALRADEFLKTVFNEENIFKIKRVNFFDYQMRVI